MIELILFLVFGPMVFLGILAVVWSVSDAITAAIDKAEEASAYPVRTLHQAISVQKYIEKQAWRKRNNHVRARCKTIRTSKLSWKNVGLAV